MNRGIKTNIEQRPFQVAILLEGFLLCGGAMLNHNTVLTAAHCIYPLTDNRYLVRAKSSYYDEGGVKSEVKKKIPHPHYNGNHAMGYDIAILKTKNPFKFGPLLQPIALAPRNLQIPNKTMVTVSGWGSIVEGGPPVRMLRRVTIPIVPFQECQNVYSFLKRDMICAGRRRRDSCQGDSGGALTYRKYHNKHNYTVYHVGVVSFGYGCGRDGIPGVYTRTLTYRNFIDAHMG